MEVEDCLDGATNFISWKPRVLLILEENDLLMFVNKKVPEPESEGDKSQWKKWCENKKDSSGLGQRSLGSANLIKEGSKEDVQDLEEVIWTQ